MRDAPHRLLIVSGLVGSVWIGFAASRFHFFDYQYECGLVDLCDYADVIRGREGHWLYFGVAALVLAVGVFLHVRRGRAVPPRPEPWSPLLLLVPGLAWALALPVEESSRPVDGRVRRLARRLLIRRVVRRVCPS